MEKNNFISPGEQKSSPLYKHQFEAYFLNINRTIIESPRKTKNGHIKFKKQNNTGLISFFLFTIFGRW